MSELRISNPNASGADLTIMFEMANSEGMIKTVADILNSPAQIVKCLGLKIILIAAIVLLQMMSALYYHLWHFDQNKIMLEGLSSSHWSFVLPLLLRLCCSDGRAITTYVYMHYYCNDVHLTTVCWFPLNVLSSISILSWMPKHWQGSGMQVVLLLGAYVTTQWSAMAEAVGKYLKQEIELSLGLDGNQKWWVFGFQHVVSLSDRHNKLPFYFIRISFISEAWSPKAMSHEQIFIKIGHTKRKRFCTKVLCLGTSFARITVAWSNGVRSFPRVLQLQCLSLIVEHQFLNDSIQSDLWFLLLTLT